MKMKIISLIAMACGVSMIPTSAVLGNMYGSPALTLIFGFIGGVITALWGYIFYWEVKHGN